MDYYLYTGHEDYELIKVRIFPTFGPPASIEATLHRVGPDHHGGDLKVDGRIGSVPDRLSAAYSLGLQYAVPYRVELDGAAWDENWGRLSKAPQ